MTDYPVPYSAESDVPLVPVDNETDPRMLNIAEQAATLSELIRSDIPEGPHVELAVRYVDLAVQAARTASREAPSSGPPLAPGGAENESPGPRPI